MPSPSSAQQRGQQPSQGPQGQGPWGPHSTQELQVDRRRSTVPTPRPSHLPSAARDGRGRKRPGWAGPRRVSVPHPAQPTAQRRCGQGWGASGSSATLRSVPRLLVCARRLGTPQACEFGGWNELVRAAPGPAAAVTAHPGSSAFPSGLAGWAGHRPCLLGLWRCRGPSSGASRDARPFGGGVRPGGTPPARRASLCQAGPW